jgi:hypothetical protein
LVLKVKLNFVLKENFDYKNHFFILAAVSKLPPIMARFVPFAAVAGANCVNLPFMRWNEIRDGIAVFDKDGKRVGGK